MKTLSIIIPAYNSEGCLSKCIQSLLHPAVLEELDILIVNDGSTDGTEALALDWCARYPGSLRLISQENRGHGGALNTGCAAAVGKYLKVIDADDWVETEKLPAFCAFLRSCTSDVVLTHHYTRDITTGEVKAWKSYPDHFGRSYSLGEIMPQWKNFDRSLTFHGITYRRDFYLRHGIALSRHVFYEDHEFATIPCCYADTVTPLDLFIYDYRIGDLAQSVSDSNQLKRLGHTEAVLNRLIREYAGLSLGEKAPGRAYFAMKTQGLLLSYLTTALLVEPDRKKGRTLAREMMEVFRQRLPETHVRAEKQYRAFLLMNRLGIRKAAWERLRSTKLYNRLRHNRDFI